MKMVQDLLETADMLRFLVITAKTKNMSKDAILMEVSHLAKQFEEMADHVDFDMYNTYKDDPNFAIDYL